MKKLLIVIILLFSGFNVQSQGCLNMDIMLVGDLSGSVDGHFYFVADAFDAFIDRFDLDNNTIRIGITVFESDAYLLSGFTSSKDTLRSATTLIRKFPHSGTSDLFTAIEVAWFQFTLNARKDSRKMIIVVSDGDVDFADYTLALIQKMKDQAGIEACGILVDTYTPKESFMVQMSEPYCYVSTGYDMLVDELQKLDLCL